MSRAKGESKILKNEYPGSFDLDNRPKNESKEPKPQQRASFDETTSDPRRVIERMRNNPRIAHHRAASELTYTEYKDILK